MERNLHDGAQQRLIGLGVLLGRAEQRLASTGDASTLTLVRQAKQETMAVVAEIRDLSRGLRPPVLESRGLDAALSAVAGRLPNYVHLDVGEERFDPTTEAILYYAITECLANVAKHAPAATAWVRLTRNEDLVTAVITDDGPGGADTTGGTGLSGIADRLAGVDGKLYLSSPQGGPTMITVEVPCAS